MSTLIEAEPKVVIACYTREAGEGEEGASLSRIYDLDHEAAYPALVGDFICDVANGGEMYVIRERYFDVSAGGQVERCALIVELVDRTFPEAD